MARLVAFFPLLVVLANTASCGDSEATLPDNATVAGANQGGAGGQLSSSATGAQSSDSTVGGTTMSSAGTSAGQSTWRYATVDEGAFPKDRVLDIQVTMEPDAWANLIATARQEIWSNATVAIDNQPLGTVALRPKGEYSLDSCVDATGKLTCDKLSFKLKFDDFNPESRFYGLKRLVLNQVLDGAASFQEPLAYQIFNDFGIVAPRTSYATLTVNGGSLGLYKVVEAVDGRFTKTRFADGNSNGNLYKEAWPGRTSNTYFAAALETNEATATNEAYIAFAKDMLAATDDTLPQTLAKYMDLGRTLDYMAVDYAIANWDGITTFYAGSWGHQNHNFYMLQSADAARFTLIPWDLNATFTISHWLGNIQPWDTLTADCNTLIPTKTSADLFTWPAACDPTIRAIALSKTGYHESVRRLLDEVFVVDRLNEQVDAYVKQIAEAMRSDPFVTYSEMTGGAQYFKNQLPALRSRLEAVLAN